MGFFKKLLEPVKNRYFDLAESEPRFKYGRILFDDAVRVKRLYEIFPGAKPTLAHDWVIAFCVVNFKLEKEPFDSTRTGIHLFIPQGNYVSKDAARGAEHQHMPIRRDTRSISDYKTRVVTLRGQQDAIAPRPDIWLMQPLGFASAFELFVEAIERAYKEFDGSRSD